MSVNIFKYDLGIFCDCTASYNHSSSLVIDWKEILKSMLQILNLGKQTLTIQILVLNLKKWDSMDYWWNDLIF